jgi:hypothetical protein
VLAPLVRGDHRYGEVRVRQALAYVCPTCGQALAFPSSSSGRIAQAMRAREPAARHEFRVPESVVDKALMVHATMGTLGAGEDFTLPLHLGLQVAGREQQPKESWKIHDGEAAGSARARPLVTTSTMEHIEGLKRAWGAPSEAQVVRWLVVAAAEAVQAGLTCCRAQPAVLIEMQTSAVRAEPVFHAQSSATAIPPTATTAAYLDQKVA